MSIRTKLVLTLGLVLSIYLTVGFFAASAYQRTAEQASEIQRETYRIVAASLAAQVRFKKQVQEWKDILLRGHEPDLYDQYLSQFFAEERETRDAIEALLPLLDEGSEARRIAEAFHAAHQRLGQQYREALTLYKQTPVDAHIAVDQEVRGIDREPTDLLDQVVTSTLEQKEARLARVSAQAEVATRQILLGAVGIVTGTILFLVWLTDRSIGRPIAAATEIAQRISEGDLSGEIHVHGHDEAARLLHSLQTMQLNLATSRETLSASEARTRLLLESSGEGIYGLNTSGECIFINTAGVQMLGEGSAERYLGKPMHDRMHHTRSDGSPYPSQQCRACRTYVTGETCQADDEVFWREDGTSFPVEYSSHPIREHGELIGAVVTFSDITARKRAEAALRDAHWALQDERALLAQRVEERTAELNLANAELASTARSKDEFLAAMSHELRTPLTTIVGTSEMLADWLYGELNDKQARAVSNIEESAHHLLALINDILDVAKVQAGGMELAWDDVPVAQLCEASLRLVRQPAHKKNLEVRLQLDPQVQVVRGDNRRLKQLLVNLLSNAVKFTPENGSVGLDVRGDAARGVVDLSVWDTGIGIAREHMERVFKPFVQLDSKLNRSYSGTGLGLALSYRMAELHGGSIAVESEVGKGSRFTVTLRWQPKDGSGKDGAGAPERLDPMDPDMAPTAGATILLAEDDPANSIMLTESLQSNGFRVVHVADGVEAVARSRVLHPDLILMDIQMPNLDGLEATRLIRSDNALKHIPIVAITALSMPGDRERCLEVGVNEYLAKPVGMRELLQTIRTQLRPAPARA